MKGAKARKKKRETEDDGGWRSPAIHPLAFWALDRVAALASTWVPCFEVLLARDGATTGLGTGRARGWAGIFPVECLRIRCFHAAWSPTSQYMSVCVCCGRGGVCVFWGSYGCSMRCPASSAPLYPKSHFVILATAAPAPGGGGVCVKWAGGTAPPPSITPPGSPLVVGRLSPPGGDMAGMGRSPCAKWETP